MLGFHCSFYDFICSFYIGCVSGLGTKKENQKWFSFFMLYYEKQKNGLNFHPNRSYYFRSEHSRRH
jgi:hypothetical protein